MPTVIEVPKETEAQAEVPVEAKEFDLEHANVQELVVRVGELQDEVDVLKAGIIKDLADATGRCKELMSAGLKPADKEELKAGDYVAKLGAMAMKREITDLQKVYDLLGHETFLELCTFTLKNIDDYTTKPQQKDFLKESQTGGRSFSVKRAKKT